MSNLPDANEPIVNKEGILTDPSRLFLSVLQSIIDVSIGLFYQGDDFDSLTQLEGTIKNPFNNMFVMVNDQGLARYKGSISAWVLAADDATLIT